MRTLGPIPWLIAVIVSFCVACGDDEPAAPRNVVFVLVDTLRADHTSLHGFERSTTPLLEELARESVVFDRARSQAGCTYPSVNSMLTSRYPFDFYAGNRGNLGIPDDVPSLGEILNDRGFHTAAVSASPIVRATPSRRNPTGGFGSGFETFDESCLWKRAECVNEAAMNTLADMEEPFFLYLHYMDPHGPYQPPATHDREFSRDYDGLDFIAVGDPQPIARMIYDDGPHLDLDDRDIRHLVDLYDDEILYFDNALRSLVGELRASGLLDRTLLVITADHGEEFLEHGHIGHCRGVWDTLTHVPLLIRAPGIRSGLRVDRAVQCLDLMPTILDLLGVDDAGIEMEGRSLRPLLEGRNEVARYAFSDQSRYRAIDDGRFQLILDGRTMTTQLLDLGTGKPAKVDDETAALSQNLNDELHGWLIRSGQGQILRAALDAGEEQHEMLRALGYLE